MYEHRLKSMSDLKLVRQTSRHKTHCILYMVDETKLLSTNI